MQIKNIKSFKKGQALSKALVDNVGDFDFMIGFTDALISESPAVQEHYFNIALDIIELLADLETIGAANVNNQQIVDEAKRIAEVF